MGAKDKHAAPRLFGLHASACVCVGGEINTSKNLLYLCCRSACGVFLTLRFFQNHSSAIFGGGDESEIPPSWRFGAAACVGGSSGRGRRRAICENRTELRAFIRGQIRLVALPLP